jgi:hypothetical protein
MVRGVRTVFWRAPSEQPRPGLFPIAWCLDLVSSPERIEAELINQVLPRLHRIEPSSAEERESPLHVAGAKYGPSIRLATPRGLPRRESHPSPPPGHRGSPSTTLPAAGRSAVSGATGSCSPSAGLSPPGAPSRLPSGSPAQPAKRRRRSARIRVRSSRRWSAALAAGGAPPRSLRPLRRRPGNARPRKPFTLRSTRSSAAPRGRAGRSRS